ncbi:hypothetical protein CD944_11895 [Brevundimonas diminuta]|nr:hypothetical protein CD944_11895 [Brevundimonas diminuta]
MRRETVIQAFYGPFHRFSGMTSMSVSKSPARAGTLTATASVLALVIGAAAAPAAAQQAQPAAAADQVSEVEEIVVVGYRAQNQRSVAAKRDDARIGEFLNSDDIGQQPDYNIADSMRRVPGVQTVFDEDEGRYVSVRGLNPSYTLGSFDGATMATAERGNRQLNMEAIPSTAVGGLEIIKSRTPDIDGNAIGGTVNLRTRSAFDHYGLYAVANAFVGASNSTGAPGKGYNRGSDDGMNFRFDGTVSQTFGDQDQFGVLLSANYSQKRRDQERFSPNQTMTDAAVTPAAPNTSLLYQGYPNTVDRYGATLKLEYKPSDALHAHLTLSHYQQDDNELRLSHQLLNTAGGSFVRFNDFPLEKPLTIAQAGFNWSPAELHRVTGRVSYSKATFLEDSRQLQFNLTGAAPTFDVSVQDGIPLATNIDPRFTDSSQYRFQSYNPYIDDSDDMVGEVQADYAYNREAWSTGWGFQAGVKLRQTERDNDRTQTVYNAWTGATPLTLDAFETGANYTPLRGAFNALIIDFDAFDDFFNANRDGFTVNQASTNINTIGSDWVVTEDVTALYGLAEHRGERHRLIFGGRWEQTETDISVMRRQGTGANVADFTRVTQSGDYDNFLPSATLSYDLTGDVKLRLAYAQAVGRPNPSQLGSAEVLNNDGSISRGNVNLKAREGQSYDASLEYYLPDNGGLLSVGVFHKSIDNEIYSLLTREVIDGVEVDVSQPQNAGEAKVSGLELNFIRNNLDFLPGFLSDFGVSANATWLNAETTVLGTNGAGRNVDFLPGQSDFLGNLAVFYERDGLSARVSYAYVGDAYSSVGAAPANDRVLKASHQVDLQARYQLNDRIELIGEVRNLIDDEKITIRNLEAAGRNHELATDVSFYGRQLWAGVAMRF